MCLRFCVLALETSETIIVTEAMKVPSPEEHSPEVCIYLFLWFCDFAEEQHEKEHLNCWSPDSVFETHEMTDVFSATPVTARWPFKKGPRFSEK